ncbi:MAG: InlB B-repeat-containing protein [Clostridia bacterium]|nr:InlB B-repeat-containing protein [Clostridia bacterium]
MVRSDYSGYRTNRLYSIKCTYSSSVSSYTVTYNANGGSVSPTSATVTAGSSTTLPTPTKSYKITYNANNGSGAPSAQTVNLTCKGWATSSGATSASYNCGASYKPTASTTLYAVWTSPVSATLSSTKPTRSGYTFLGWSTSSSATSATYSAGGSISLSANATLYAVWKQNSSSSYTVTYNPNGGSVSPTSATVTAGSSTTLPTPTKSYKITYNANNGSGAPSAQTVNLTCKGWATSSTATSANYSCGASYKPTASTTLYAVWTSPVSATLSSTKPARSGYTFLGWSTSSSATSATYSAGGNISLTGNATLYAVWSSNTPTPTNAGIQIRNYTPHREEAYRTTITLTAETSMLLRKQPSTGIWTAVMYTSAISIPFHRRRIITASKQN